jgi:hypothetical protein
LLIEAPPLLAGAVHDTLKEDPVALDVTTRVGTPGTTSRVDAAVDGLENVPVPSVFTAAIWNS